MDSRPSPDLIPADLAPGDTRAVGLDWSDLRVERIQSPEHPLFRRAYDRLWREFGPRGEMERQEVIVSRFSWDPSRPVCDHALLYEMLVVLRGETIVGLRDHTAIVPMRPTGARRTESVIVHLSHNLVEPPLRGSGLAGWLRALPLQTARECATRAGWSSPSRHITLVAEMEPFDELSPPTAARLRSYGRAGFLAIDPGAVDYRQPDFREPAEIERTSLRSVPLMLIVRRVGREPQTSIPACEVRAIVTALYSMFARHVAPEYMDPLWTLRDHLPEGAESIALLPPLPT